LQWQIFIKTTGQGSRKMFELEFLSIYEDGSCLRFVIRIISARHKILYASSHLLRTEYGISRKRRWNRPYRIRCPDTKCEREPLEVYGVSRFYEKYHMTFASYFSSVARSYTYYAAIAPIIYENKKALC